MPINRILRGDSLQRLHQLPEESIDMVMTSPPYWGLRDYEVRGQIGLERHPHEYLKKLWTVFDEVKRVLKKTGSIYVNMGDTYYCSSKDGWLVPKQLMLIPSRFAIGMQERGWTLRNDIIWVKPNTLPSSVKDRLSPKHEHVFHFVKSRKYYYDLDAIRVPCKNPKKSWNNAFNYRVREAKKKHYSIIGVKSTKKEQEKYNQKGEKTEGQNNHEKGKNPGDVWTINTKPFPEAHFAVYPEELCEKPIKSSCPKKGIVLDPFAGSGTTLLIAKKLQRKYLGIELNKKYIKIAKKRIDNTS